MKLSQHLTKRQGFLDLEIHPQQSRIDARKEMLTPISFLLSQEQKSVAAVPCRHGDQSPESDIRMIYGS